MPNRPDSRSSWRSWAAPAAQAILLAAILLLGVSYVFDSPDVQLGLLTLSGVLLCVSVGVEVRARLRAS